MLFAHPSPEIIPGVNIFLFFALLVVIHLSLYYFFVQKLRQFECLPGIKFQGLHPVGGIIPYTNLYLDYVSFGTSSKTTLDIELFTEKYNLLIFFSSLSDVWEFILWWQFIYLRNCGYQKYTENHGTQKPTRFFLLKFHSMKTTKYSKNVGIHFIVT